jgi:hypothetical protein
LKDSERKQEETLREIERGTERKKIERERDSEREEKETLEG